MKKTLKSLLCAVLALNIAFSACVTAGASQYNEETPVTVETTAGDLSTMVPPEEAEAEAETASEAEKAAVTTAPYDLSVIEDVEVEYEATKKTTKKAETTTAAKETTKKTTKKTTKTTKKTTHETIKATPHVSGYNYDKYYKIKHNLKYMAKLNDDFIGWLTIKDTPIDIPVVQATDNKFYLEHDFYGRYDNTKVGTTFADYRVPVTKKSRPQNLIIYGHNIRTGVGLAKITNYYPSKYGSLDFYLKHPTFEYESRYGGESTYVVFAGMFVNTESEHGSVFNYFKYRDFTSKTQFYRYFEGVFDRSVFYNPKVNIAYDDEFITLSTCYYPMGMDVDTRFVVFARKLREGESAKIDVSKAYTNKSPLYFKYYYTVNGGKWAGRKWSKNLMKGYSSWLKTQ